MVMEVVRNKRSCCSMSMVVVVVVTTTMMAMALRGRQLYRNVVVLTARTLTSQASGKVSANSHMTIGNFYIIFRQMNFLADGAYAPADPKILAHWEGVP